MSQLLISTGAPMIHPDLEQEYRTLIRVLPVNVSAYLLLGDLYIRTGNAAPPLRF